MSAATISSPLYSVTARLDLKRNAIAAERQAHAQRERELVRMVAMERLTAAQEKLMMAENDAARVKAPASPKDRPASPWSGVLAKLRGGGQPTVAALGGSLSSGASEQRTVETARAQLERLQATENPALIEHAEAVAVEIERRDREPLSVAELPRLRSALVIPTEGSNRVAPVHEPRGTTVLKNGHNGESATTEESA